MMMALHAPHCRLLLLCAALAGCGRGEGKSIPPRPPPMVVANPVTVREVQVTVRAPIDLRPIAQVDVGSKSLGYLDVVLVDRGDVVRKGQLLALVRPSDLPQQLAEAKNVLAQAQASKLLARTNAERSRSLAPTGVVSQQEVQQTAAALSAAAAAEAAAKSRIVAFGIRIGEMRIEAPISGVVSQRRLDPGALVGPPGGGAIVTIVRMDTMRSFIAVNEQYAARISVGQAARIELDALPGRPITGHVVRLAPAFDPLTRTLDAEVHLENKDGVLRPGMYGRGAIILATHPGALTVPVAAVQITRSQTYVYVVRGDRVHQRQVKVGVESDDWLEVTAGLTAGDKVVTAGVEGLAEGMKVRVAEGVNPFSGKKERPAGEAAAAEQGGASGGAGTKPVRP